MGRIFRGKPILIYLFLGIISFAVSPAVAATSDNLIDYESLNHRIILTKLRAGNHDSSGMNRYFFAVKVYALPISQQERGKSFDERRKISRDLGTFTTNEVKSLSFLRLNEDNPPQKKVKGDLIRELAAEAMRTFELAETRIAILVRIEMFEENKKFFFFGEDTYIGRAKYELIPESLPHKPVTESKRMEITDDKGTYVQLTTRFTPPEERTAAR
jgi:hypothetical protein